VQGLDRQGRQEKRWCQHSSDAGGCRCLSRRDVPLSRGTWERDSGPSLAFLDQRSSGQQAVALLANAREMGGGQLAECLLRLGSAALPSLGNPGANLRSISHICHPILVTFVWELTKETIDLPLGCLQGGSRSCGGQRPLPLLQDS